MVGMPYDLEKGPYFSVVEDFLSDPKRLVETLLKLRKGVEIANLGVLESPTLTADGRSVLDRARHLNEDWFGMEWHDAEQHWHVQPATACPPTEAVQQTGFWKNWRGDAEAIFRETIIRAIEVAIGIDHGDAIKATDRPPRVWPIELFWKCQGPWFEGWITWRAQGKGSDRTGQVTVIMATPGNGSPIRRSPRRGGPAEGYEVGPKRADGDHGMWVVAHEQEERVHILHSDYTAATEAGEFPIPTFGPGFVGCGDIVVVAPAERDGGVLATGRQWEAGPASAPPIPEVVR